MADAPTKRFTLLMLWQAHSDHATELVLDPAPAAGSYIRYQVAGQWHDFSPPPAEFIPGVIIEIEALAGFAEGPYPKQGTIHLPYSGLRLHWHVRRDAPNSACILTRLPL